MALGHEHCDYCPPSEAAADGDCDDASQCAYPHEPGVDARAGGMACLAAGPVAAPISLAAVAVPLFHAAADEIEPGRQRSLAIQYCRFIE